MNNFNYIISGYNCHEIKKEKVFQISTQAKTNIYTAEENSYFRDIQDDIKCGKKLEKIFVMLKL